MDHTIVKANKTTQMHKSLKLPSRTCKFMINNITEWQRIVCVCVCAQDFSCGTTLFQKMVFFSCFILQCISKVDLSSLIIIYILYIYIYIYSQICHNNQLYRMNSCLNRLVYYLATIRRIISSPYFRNHIFNNFQNGSLYLEVSHNIYVYTCACVCVHITWITIFSGA